MQLNPGMTPRDQREYFTERYSVLYNRSLMPESKIEFIGHKDIRVCRYCGRGKPEATFRKKAHALPELIGNRRLFAYDECDACNDLFSSSIEDYLAKYLCLRRTFSRIHGKKGVPSYKCGKFMIDVDDTVIKLNHPRNSGFIEHDPENSRLTVSVPRQPYIPMAVFKTFVKMALAVMPLDDLTRCSHLIAWILNKAHTPESLPMTPLLVLEQSTPSTLGVKPYPGLSVCLFRRRDAVKDCPYMYLAVAFGNTRYQVLVPMPDADHHFEGRDFDFAYLPIPFDGKDAFSGTTCRLRDFQSDQVMRGEVEKVVLSYSNRERVDAL
jgi:hypothetical protein